MEYEPRKRYGQWAGNERGFAEKPANCVEEIFSGRSFIGSQCKRSRGFGPDGLYCKQHAKRQEAMAAARSGKE